MTSDIVYTRTEARKLLKIGRSKFDKLIKDGTIRTIDFGGLKRISKAEIERHLEGEKS